MKAGRGRPGSTPERAHREGCPPPPRPPILLHCLQQPASCRPRPSLNPFLPRSHSSILQHKYNHGSQLDQNQDQEQELLCHVSVTKRKSATDSCHVTADDNLSSIHPVFFILPHPLSSLLCSSSLVSPPCLHPLSLFPLISSPHRLSSFEFR